MRRRLTSLFGCLVVAGAMSQAAMGPSAAEENPPKPSPAGAQQTPLERAQEPLVAIAGKIENLASGQNLDRYTGVEVSPERNLVIVYWAGRMPTSVAAILDQARRQGITTDVRQAKYSKAQLDEARYAVLRDPRSLAVGISLVYPNRDGSGITVGVAGSLSEARGLDAVRNSAVPVTLYPQPMMKPVLGRYNDTAPFWGGAAYYVDGYGGCTTGFGVHDPTTFRTFMLTAAHCFGTSTMGRRTWILDPRDPRRWIIRTEVGPTYREWHGSRVDAGIIDTSTGATIYTQGIDPYYSYISVAGHGTSGSYVKTSGAFSGERSGIKVINEYVTYRFIGPWGGIWELDGAMADRPDSANAAGEGDSGGPVFRTLADGRAIAVGVISAVDPNKGTGCTGIREVPDPYVGVRYRNCSWRVFYPRVANILAAGNISINTY